MSDLLIYALSVYAVFHFLTRSDMMRRPREWVLARSPRCVRYVSTCAFCFTAWLAIALMVIHLLLTGELRIVPTALMAAPVINLVLDLIVTALRRANEPPVIQVTASPSTTTTGSVLATVTAVSDIRAGQLVVTRLAPQGWEHTNRDNSPYRTSGILRWWPGGLVGRRVRVHAGFIGEVHDGREGRIVDGDGPSLFGYDAGCIRDCDWFYIIQPDDGKGNDRITVAVNHCTFLDGLDAPFNPLDHEQTK